MSGSILVAYATKYCSTQEVAGAVAATPRECRLDVDIHPMSEVRAVEGYPRDYYGSAALNAPLAQRFVFWIF